MTATASGTDAYDAIGSLTLQIPANLVGVSVAATPLILKQGRYVEVVLAVNNAGQATANASPSVEAGPTPVGMVVKQSGPLPSGPVDIAGGQSRAFTWTYRAMLSGLVSFAPVVSGADANSGASVSASMTTFSVTITAAAVLDATLDIVPSQVRAGLEFEARQAVTNIGSKAATNVTSALALSDSSLAQVAQAPAGGVTLNPGDSTTFVWKLDAKREGILSLTASVSGTDQSDGETVTGVVQATLAIEPRVAGLNDGALLVAPTAMELSNPASEVRLYVKGTPNETVHIRIYTAIGGYMGKLRVVLDGVGEGEAAYLADGIGGKKPGPGAYWAVARGGGINDKKMFFVLIRKNR